MKSLMEAGGLGDFDAHLADRTYVMGGHEATSADAVAFEVGLAVRFESNDIELSQY